MNKLIRILAVLLLAGMVCVISIVALALVSDPVDNPGTSEPIAKSEKDLVADVTGKLADGTETPLPPTAAPVIPTAKPTDEVFNIAYLVQAWDYFDSMSGLADAMVDDLIWLTDMLEFATDMEDIFTLCAIAEANMDLAIVAFSNLDPTDDLIAVHLMYLESLDEYRLGMQGCQAGDMEAFNAHTDIGLAIMSNANDLVDLWEPEG